ncbi:putative Ig domain-containing protein [Teredinibacter turnerae]|uniref:putative Ig domain-containing protein n=1 Tax=Teredinibacter turnerae TaxID=2426 RepID=UPI0030CCF277
MFGKESVRAHNAKPSVVFKLLSKWIYITKIVKPACKCVAIVGLTAASALQPALANDAFDFALGFNAFIGNEFSAVSSDVQGKLAAGGNITLASYGVSSVYRAEPQEDVLISGGNIQYQNGQIFAGSVLAAGSTAGIGSEVLSAMPLGSHVLPNSNLPFSFYDEFQALQDFSNQLSELTPTGTTEYKWGGTHLTGDCESETQVFNIDGNSLLNSNSLVLNCTPETSTLLLNITGDHAGLKNIGLAHLSERATRTLYNFPEATSVELVWVGVEGTVLAPLAHFDNPRGSLNGTIIAKSWDGPMELHHVPFHGEFQGMQQRENQAPVYHSVPIVEAFTETDYQYQIIVDDPDLDPITIAMVTSPEGMTLDPETGLILWRPSVEQLANHPVVISATDGEATVLQEFSIAVSYSNSAPSIEPLSDISMPEGDALEIPINATDREGDSLEYAASNLPNFATLENNVLKLQPGYDNSGYYADILISVTDGVFRAFESFSIEILDVNRAPQIISEPILSVLEGSLYAYPIVIQDPDINAVLSLALLQGPEGMSLDADNNQLVWTPTAADIGDHEIKIEVADELGLSDDQAYTLQVVNVNDAPILSDLSIEVNEDEALQIVLEGLDADGDTLSYELVSSPQNGTLSGEFPTISYTPHLNYFGEDHFGVISNDGIANSNIATVSITVLAINDAPTVSSDPILSVAENQLYQYQILGSDVDGDVLSYNAITELPSGASLSSEGLLSWIPDFSQAGEYAISIEVSDSHETTELSYTLTVLDVNRIPQISDIAQDIPANQSSTIAITAVDPDGDSLSYAITSFPLWGKAALNGDKVTYTPADGFIGEDTLVYQVSDGKNYAEATLTLVVLAENQIPEIISEPKKFATVGAAYIYQVEAYDADGDELSYRLKTAPETMLIDDRSGIVRWLPVNEGQEDILIEVDDGKGGVTEHRYTIDSIADVVDVSYTGTEFWLMFNAQIISNVDLSLSGIEFHLFFGSLSETDINVLIDVPGLGYQQSVIIEPSSIAQVDLTEIMPELNFDEVGISDTAIRVSADADISVVLLNRKAASTDSALVLPTDAQGNKYIATSYTSPKYTKIRGYGNKGEENRPFLGVVATQDNTEVTVTPSFTYNDGEAEREENVPYSITLDQGQTYQVYGKGDITGTAVDADKPIAVFSGNSCAYLQENYCDHIVENLLPVSAWSAQYFVTPLALREKGDTFAVYAAFDDTVIDVNGVKIAKLNRGEHYEFIEHEASNILGNKPFALIQFSNGSMYDQKNIEPIGDPAMLMVQPVDHYLSEYIVTTLPETILAQTGEPFRYHFANLVAHEKVKNTILLNGEPVSVEWKSIPDSSYYGASIALVAGAHKFAAAGRFGLYVYGYDLYDSYANYGGSALTKQVNPGALELKQDGESSLMAGDQACLLAEITDDMGIPVSRGQVLFSAVDELNGYAQSQVSISNADGRARACFRNATSTVLNIGAHWAGLLQNIDISWIANTRSVDAVPMIVSEPNFYVTPGESYTYAVEAIDPKGDALRYSLDKKPSGMQIDEETGVITWLVPIDFNETVINIQVSDDVHFVEQKYRLAVEPGLNRAPIFESNPETDFILWNPDVKVVDGPFMASHVYTYAVKVLDPDYDQGLVYSVIGPRGMSIDPDSGLLKWIPDSEQIGTHWVEISIDDNMGAVNTQNFKLVLVDDHYPVLAEGIPLPQIATQGHSYRIQIVGGDEDGDKLRYTLIAPPVGASISNTGGSEGVLSWTPSDSQIGNHEIQVNISDNNGKSVNIVYPVTVVPNTGPSLVSGETTLKWSYNYYQCETYAFGDPEGDSLSILAPEKPAAMTVKTLTGGDTTGFEVCWTPTDSDVGPHKFEITVSDTAGEMVTIPISIDIVDDLIVRKEPDDQRVILPETVRTQFLVTNPDGTALTYNLIPEVAGMSIDQANGTITWSPTESDLGQYTITAKASAGEKFVETTFQLEVRSINEDPIVEPIAPIEIQARRLFKYSISASDGNNDTLIFSKGSGFPSHMTLSESGELSWIPFVGQVGLHQFKVVVEDGFGEQVIAPMEINVIPFENTAPELVSNPSGGAVIGYPYQEQLHIIDADGDPITVTKLNGTPTSVTVDSAGAIQWQPQTEDEGLVNIGVRLADDYSFREYYWNVDVKPTLLPVAVRASVVPQYLQEGEQTELSIALDGGINPVVDSITVDGEPIALQQAYSYLLNAKSAGRHDLVITATDNQTNETASTTLFYAVADASDDEVPVVTLAAPEEQNKVTKVADVIGSVADDNLAEWLLFYRPAGASDEVYTILARGDTSFDEQVIAEFDARQLTNGLYQVVLQATDINNKTVTTGANVFVDGSLKIGNFGFTVEDLSLSMSGIPITVTRTYDSRRKESLMDFGYGWSIDYQSIVINESVEPSLGWERVVQKALFNIDDNNIVMDASCLYPVGEKVVTITLPSGDVETFSVRAENVTGSAQSVSDPNCYLTAGQFFKLTFDTKDNTQSHLSSKDGEYLAFSNESGNLTADITDVDAASISLYTLTTRSGYTYELDQHFGILTVTDPNGHILTYSDDGVAHSSGKSIVFERDGLGRIETISDPKGNTYRYFYDTKGDLEEVRDAHQVTEDVTGTTYAYNHEHALVDILDPLNRKILKNLYDDEGRLYAQEDGEGNTKYFDHDLDANTSIVTDRDGRTTAFVYDDKGLVKQEIVAIGDGSYTENIVTAYTYDDNGNQETKFIGSEEYTWTTKYDADNNLSYSIDPEKHRVDYLEYNALGQETKIKDEMGRLTSMNYDAAGNLTQIDMPAVIDPDTGEEIIHSASNIINAQGQVESTTDLRGLTTTYTYYPPSHSAAGMKWTESNPETGTLTYTYDANNNVETETRERTVDGLIVQETVTYEYDSRNRLLKTIYPDDSYTETVYDPAGNLDKERDRFGVWTDYTYNAYGRLTDTLYADGSTEVRSYTPEGLLETVTDRSRHTTRYDYDDAGRRWKITYHDQSYTETRYTPQGWVQFEWDENRNLTEYEYDLAGKRKAVIRHYTDAAGNPQQQRHSFTYYDNGELHTETDASNYTTTYVINALDQRIETQFENGTSAQTRYDAMGARTRSIDQNTRATDYRYDDLGRLEEIQPDVTIEGQRVPITSYTYDEVGNKLSQTDANNHSTSWTYDYFGRVLSRTLPEQMTEYFVYDDTVRTRTHTDFNGQVSVTQFNNLGQVETVSYDNGTSESYTYWPNGQIRQVTDKNGVTNYVYDDRDRIDHEIQSDGTRLDYDYDDAGNRTLVEITRDDTVVSSTSYTYDGLNRLETVTDTNGTTRYTYDAVGNLDTVTYPNGIVEEYDYNDVNQLIVLTVRDASQNVIASYTYALDYTGCRESITEAGGRFTDFKYDDLYRLTDEIITDNLAGNHTANYQYDWVGNRTYETVNGVETLYLYDDNDRLEQQGGTVYGYDDNGNLITETLDGVTTTYHYDERNKLIQLEAAEATTEYTYNHNGIRTSKTQGGVATQYIVDANRDYAQVLLETGDTQDVFYTYGHDLISQLRANTPSFYIYDGLGSTRALSDSAGAISDTYDYEAFGELLNQTGATENDYLFTGEQFDRSVDQYYLRARYYDQGVGRFTQMDTWMGNNYDPVSLHKYLYANADPVSFVDPSGYFGTMSLGGFGSLSSIQGALLTASIPVAGLTTLSAIKVLNGDSSGVDDNVTPLDIAVARVRARTCVQNGDDDCELGIPVVIFGSDMWDATNHYWEAQTFMGLPQILNRGTGFNRGWYTRLSVPECLGRGMSQQCDEYPFNSTTQGGPANYAAGRVSLKLVNGIHNGAAGTLLESMYNTCGVRAGSETDSTFAAIPVPGGESGFFCPGQ